MKTKEITICGKQVMLAYCFATELAFKNFTGLEIEDFDPTNRDHIIYMILSAVAAYYQKREEDAPVKDTDLMYESKPTEISVSLAVLTAFAVSAIIGIDVGLVDGEIDIRRTIVMTDTVSVGLEARRSNEVGT